MLIFSESIKINQLENNKTSTFCDGSLLTKYQSVMNIQFSKSGSERIFFLIYKKILKPWVIFGQNIKCHEL